MGIDPEEVFERIAPVERFIQPITGKIVGCPKGALGRVI